MRKIKSMLVERGIYQSDIARDLNVSGALVSKVVSGKDRSRRVQEKIANVLGLPYEKLWEKTA